MFSGTNIESQKDSNLFHEDLSTQFKSWLTDLKGNCSSMNLNGIKFKYLVGKIISFVQLPSKLDKNESSSIFSCCFEELKQALLIIRDHTLWKINGT